MVYLKSWHKWWILSICLVGIVVAWGRHFSFVNYFLFDHLPFYSKFRAPSMALIMPQFGCFIGRTWIAGISGISAKKRTGF
jgi:hypothetical protein